MVKQFISVTISACNNIFISVCVFMIILELAVIDTLAHYGHDITHIPIIVSNVTIVMVNNNKISKNEF